MTTDILERDTKWSSLIVELEDVVRENNKKPKEERLTLKDLFNEFAENRDTTAFSANKHYYKYVVPKLNRKPLSLDDSIEEYNNTTTIADLYKDVRSVYRVGEIVEVTVTKIEDYGVFVKTTDGFDGLIHISQMTREYVLMPEDYFYIGEILDAKIIRFEGEKLNLSTKALGGKAKLNKSFASEEPVQEDIEVYDLNENEEEVEEPMQAVETVNVVKDSEKDKIMEYIKSYSGGSVSKESTADVEELIAEHGVFETTLALLEVLRDLNISKYITSEVRERFVSGGLR